MTPKQSLTRKRSLIRRSLIVLSTVLLATAWAVGTRDSRERCRAQGARDGVRDYPTTYTLSERRNGAQLVQGEKFEVLVRVVDRNGEPATVSKDTTIVLEDVRSGRPCRGNRQRSFREAASAAPSSRV